MPARALVGARGCCAREPAGRGRGSGSPISWDWPTRPHRSTLRRPARPALPRRPDLRPQGDRPTARPRGGGAARRLPRRDAGLRAAPAPVPSAFPRLDRCRRRRGRKRLQEPRGGAVRIMTVHGSKDLQGADRDHADMTGRPQPPARGSDRILWPDGRLAVPLWGAPRRGWRRPPASPPWPLAGRAARGGVSAPPYVALTRAQDRPAPAAMSASAKRPPHRWHALCEAACATWLVSRLLRSLASTSRDCASRRGRIATPAQSPPPTRSRCTTVRPGSARRLRPSPCLTVR